jgi:hypothetical protein
MGKYHCTIDLLFDWLGMSCMTTDKFLFLSKPVKQELNGAVILPPFSIPCGHRNLCRIVPTCKPFEAASKVFQIDAKIVKSAAE